MRSAVRSCWTTIRGMSSWDPALHRDPLLENTAAYLCDVVIILSFHLLLMCSIPFSVDELSSSLQEKDFEDVKPAEELLENPAFHFLQDS